MPESTEEDKQEEKPRIWVYGDNGVHWLKYGSASEDFHDFPCDKPWEHRPGDLEV